MKKKQKTGVFLLLSNLGLLITTTVIVGGAYYLYNKEVQTATFAENRFLTVEWHLLQELKAETDRKILEKDREIDRLRAAYYNLRAEGKPEEVLAQALSLVEQAEEERKSIWKSAETVSKTALPESAVLVESTAEQDPILALPGNSTYLIPLLSARVEALEAELAASREHVQKLEADLAAGEAAGLTAENLQVYANRELAALRTRGGLDMRAIRTRSLLRALVSTPEIQGEYPDLLDDLEEGYEAYGREAHTRGQREAWERVLSHLQESRNP